MVAPIDALLSINGLGIEVCDFVCEPIPPVGNDVKVRFRTGSHNYADLGTTLSIIFPCGDASYRGRFRLASCSLEPESSEFEYVSVEPVDKL